MRRFAPAGIAIFLTMAAPALGQTLQDARDAYFRGDRTQARELVDRLLRAAPADTDVLEFASNIAWWDGDADRAAESAERWVEQSDRRAQASSANDELAVRAALRARIKKFHLSGTLTSVSAPADQGTEASADLSYRYSGREEIAVGALRAARIFGGQVALTDVSAYLRAVNHLSHDVYLESRVSVTADPDFSSRYALDLETHWIVGSASETSFGARYAVFPERSVWLLRPAYTWVVADRWTITARSYIAVVDEPLASLQLRADGWLSSRWGIQGSVAAGRSYDGQGLKDHFKEAGLGVRYRLSSDWTVRIDGTSHTGLIREEKRVGMGVECIF